MDRLHRPAARARDPHRRRGARGDAGARDSSRHRRRRRAGAAARARQPEQRAARRRPLGHRRPDVGLRPPLAGRRAGRARVRAADRRGAPARELPAAARRRSRASSPTHVLTGRVSLLGPRYPDDAALRGPTWSARWRGCARCPGSSPRAPAATCRSAGTQQQRHHSRRLRAEAGRIGRLAEPALRVARLSRSAEGPAQRAAASSPTPTPPTRRASSSSTNSSRRSSGPIRIRSASGCTCPTSRRTSPGPGPTVTWLQVVGVVGEVKLKGLEEGENTRAGAYYQAVRAVAVTRHRPGDPGAAATWRRRRPPSTRALAEVDPDMPLTDVFSMSDRIEQVAQPAACADAAVARLRRRGAAARGDRPLRRARLSRQPADARDRHPHGARQRRRRHPAADPGRRRAARGRRPGGGFAGALALRGAIAAQLFGVGALDPLVMAGAVGILAATSLVACLGRRAARCRSARWWRCRGSSRRVGGRRVGGRWSVVALVGWSAVGWSSVLSNP